MTWNMDPVQGVWVVGHDDYGFHVDQVHASEIEALRALNTNSGMGWSAFHLPFGADLQETARAAYDKRIGKV